MTGMLDCQTIKNYIRMRSASHSTPCGLSVAHPFEIQYVPFEKLVNHLKCHKIAFTFDGAPQHCIAQHSIAWHSIAYW